MSDAEHDPVLPAAPSRTAATKSQRTLACAACQQRKVKCDRKFPCNTCVKSNIQCVPIAAPRQRRRRFPEAELLLHVRRLEDLLRKHEIAFEPLHGNAVQGREKAGEKEGGSPEIKTETEFEAKFVFGYIVDLMYRNLWHAMNQKVQPHRGLSLMEEVLIANHQSPHPTEHDSDEDHEDNDTEDLRDVAGKKTWDQMYKKSTDFLLFGSLITDVELDVLHPDQGQVFKLWQIYLENVNPLLKVTHTPTLQMRFVNAVGHLKGVEPNLEALMFSVYCAAVMSLSMIECRGMFGCEKEDLMQRYRFGCQQALLKCGFLQTDDLDCLTALFLYLVAVRPDTDPRSLSSLLGLTLRIAQRMGLDTESSNARCGPLEGEMRRRLWWALLLFDSRVCEMGDYRASTLSPSWNCAIPANLNDFDLQPEMQTLPQSHDRPTEITLAILRYKVADLVRHSTFFLDFTNPAMKAIAKPSDHGDNLELLAKNLEADYLSLCNPENPYQFMTIWLARGHIARYLLFQHFSIPPSHQTSLQRSSAVSHALTMLSCDTVILTSAAIKRHTWFLYFHFPFPAYVHILQSIKRDPLASHAKTCWKALSESCAVRFKDPEQDEHPFHKTPIFRVFTRIILKAWDARVAALEKNGGEKEEEPFIVSEFKKRVGWAETEQGMEKQEVRPSRFEGEDEVMPFPMIGSGGPFDCFEEQGDLGFGGGDGMDGNGFMDVDVGTLDLSGVDWSSMGLQSG
ncbi:hypothetical protein E4T38_04372 [Aureobasidium subglaciale]|nr:hypothetical protein E4T38_04372 [Aureobasidium subglaciale]KAI5224090.1 hypothetical protein E4T40_04148 [Aureobasidium subglaciale]KAI5228292.1 hypothetical protein E4T41_03909 [Aureobasidium subglaciale]KAI5262967.1 hypothetical protein E4T46_04116 [Aureobasidium subglaciale]